MLTPRNKRVKKEDVVTGTTPTTMSSKQTKTVVRRDGVTPKKDVVIDYTTTWKNLNGKGGLQVDKTDIDKIVKTKYNRKGEKKSVTIMENDIATLRPNGDTPLSYSPVIKPR